MNIKFNVDAFPGREFLATVRQVRLAPKTVQNVVTYTIIAQAPNADLSLLPGMTATARVIIEERNAAIRIPNSALRYTPVGFQAPAAAPTAGNVAGAIANAQATGQITPDQAARAAQFANGGGGGGQFVQGGGGQGGQGAAAAGGGGQNRQQARAGGNAPAAETTQGNAQGNAKNAQAAAGGNAQGNAQGNAKNAQAGGGAGAAGGNVLAQLAQLGLSEQQQAQIAQAVAAARTAAQGAGGTQQEIQQRMQTAQRAAIVAALTPEQRTRFEALERQQPAAGGVAAGGGANAQIAAATPDVAPRTAGGARNAASRARAARVFILGEDGKPVAINIMIGITDGGFTEMVAGDLQPGTKVITGSNEVAAAPQAAAGAGIGGLFGGGGGGGPQVFIK